MNPLQILLRDLDRNIKRLFFVNGIGVVSKEYAEIKDSCEKMAFLAENFGSKYPLVLQDRNFTLWDKVRSVFGVL